MRTISASRGDGVCRHAAPEGDWDSDGARRDTGALAGVFLALAIAAGLASRRPGSMPRMVGDRVWPFAVASATLGAVAALAALIAATRAARMNPTAALREE